MLISASLSSLVIASAVKQSLPLMWGKPPPRFCDSSSPQPFSSSSPIRPCSGQTPARIHYHPGGDLLIASATPSPRGFAPKTPSLFHCHPRPFDLAQGRLRRGSAIIMVGMSFNKSLPRCEPSLVHRDSFHSTAHSRNSHLGRKISGWLGKQMFFLWAKSALAGLASYRWRKLL